MASSVRKQAAAAALGLLAAAFVVPAQAQIKVALVIPTTGPVTQYGDMIKEGAATAVEMANAAGGINGKQLELVAIDDACEPKQGPVAANRVVNSKIGYVIGPVCSGAAIAAAPIYNNEGVVVVTPSATAPALTDGKNFHFIFRTIGRDDQQGPAAAKFIAERIKPKKVAILHDKQSYGQGKSFPTRCEPEAGREIPMRNEPGGVLRLGGERLEGSRHALGVDHRSDGDRHERSTGAHARAGAPGGGRHAGVGVWAGRR